MTIGQLLSKRAIRIRQMMDETRGIAEATDNDTLREILNQPATLLRTAANLQSKLACEAAGFRLAKNA